MIDDLVEAKKHIESGNYYFAQIYLNRACETYCAQNARAPHSFFTIQIEVWELNVIRYQQSAKEYLKMCDKVTAEMQQSKAEYFLQLLGRETAL